MAQYAWPTFIARRNDRHLVVAYVPSGVAADPAALVRLVMKRLVPEGDFALSAQDIGSGTLLFCAFALGNDADCVGEALSCREPIHREGWASERHCVIDRATARAIEHDCVSRF